jgi:hypothetical protein
MGNYEGTTTVEVPRDDLFDYLSRIENLPKVVARMTEAHSLTGDEVSVEARVEPGDVGTDGAGPAGGLDEESERTVHGEGWFRIDADHRRLEWGADGPHDYHGELRVTADDVNVLASRVVIRLHTLREDAPGIEQGLTETLENIELLTPSDLL